ncbi:hypothetical protein [Alloactinosynnema sp. L-07]|uniref:DUF397 domain-containing protein n=1 Tax=Alloactinosynnema sp. L-07 TaxID=1653480 RepID=UPI00065EF0B7|nr:DUF397 domain-containing protein [Alloactinosynnema sp. L-07]CRK59217.1 hypothetical protein [Alloactinosynnema sp. L-07]
MIYESWAGASFRKSSFSGGESGSCVELAWRKSSFSGGASGSCVEIAQADDLFGIRDSKNISGPVLELTGARGRALIAAVRDGRITE